MPKNIVVIGGGHGLAAILAGIKDIEDVNISAIVTVADDGGSTGRIRENYDIPAMGDLRNILLAVSNTDPLVKNLLEFRFDGAEEKDIMGHNLGNLVLTALTSIKGSFLESIDIMSKFLNVKVDIIPSSSQFLTLYAIMEDDTIVRGEKNIPHINNRIKRVYYQNDVIANTKALEAIEKADYIIYGIGSIYTSILAILIIDEIKKAIDNSNGKKIYFANAMTQPGETDRYTLEDHVRALNEHGAKVDVVIKPKDILPNVLVQKYELKGSRQVMIAEKEHDYQIIEDYLLSFNANYIRHDYDLIKQCIIKYLGNN